MRILENQPKQVKWLLIAGGVLLFIVIALYFATKKKTATTATDPASQAGQLPSVLVLPTPYLVNNPPPTQPPINPPTAPAPISPPLGILGGPILVPPSGQPTPIAPAPTGPTSVYGHGIVTYPAA